MPHYSYRLVCGPMFAGKTSTLIKDYQAAKDRGDGVLIIAPEIDTRHSGHSIVSHDGATGGPVFRVRNFETLSAAVSRLPYSRPLSIFIDECQFLDVGFEGDFLEAVMFALAGRDVTVHMGFYGLDRDAKMRSWPMTDRIRLLPRVQVSTIAARCHICNAPAPYTDRHSDGEVVQIGGTDVYFPVCEAHHRHGVAAQGREMEQAA